MRYIDKRKQHELAHAINVRFLRDCYAQDLSHPLPSPGDTKQSFEDFKKSAYRDGPDGWKALLLNEQTAEGAPRCCYCMRKLDEKAGMINYEHVIPRMLKGKAGLEDYEYYCRQAPVLAEHVVLADAFCNKTFTNLDDIDRETKMPHTTALTNLLAACNGTRDTFESKGCCCNGARGESRLLPIMLMQDAESFIKYDANGLVISFVKDDDTWRDTLDQLNSDTLKEIRSVWHRLSRVDRNLTGAVNMPLKERIEWFKSAYSTDNFAELPENVRKYAGISSGTGTYWHLLLAYDWFYYYPGYASQRKFA